MQKLKEGAKINMTVELKRILMLQHGGAEMDPFLLCPSKADWAQILLQGTWSQERSTVQGTWLNLGVSKALSSSVLHGRCIALLFSIEIS